jgi:hypothetical protein
MMRSSVVLPQPEGPSRATSSPVGNRGTRRQRGETAELLADVLTWMLIFAVLGLLARLAGLALDPGLDDQGHQRQQRQQRGHRKAAANWYSL